MLRSKIVTDASVLITFNIAVMLNDRLDLSKEFLSQSFLNFSLILVNILIPASVVVEQLYQNKKKGKSASPATKAEEEGVDTANPLRADGAFEREAGLDEEN